MFNKKKRIKIDINADSEHLSKVSYVGEEDYLKKGLELLEDEEDKPIKEEINEIKEDFLESTSDEKTIVEEVKDALKPIAIHEAKSAYYKLKLVKIVAEKGFKGVKKGLKNRKEKNKGNNT